MSEVGKDFIFIHIPKTGGSTVREILRLNFNTVVKPPNHGIPDDLDRPLIFTFVRHPAFWLRSFWNNRRRVSWVLGGRGSELWYQITKELCPLREDSCDDFLIRVSMEKPGVVGDFFNKFKVPGIQVGRTEFLDADLEKILPQITRFREQVNVGVDKPRIQLGAFEYISSSERKIIKEYYLDETDLMGTIWKEEII